jgi:branched-chain amino acid transport system permease protein
LARAAGDPRVLPSLTAPARLGVAFTPALRRVAARPFVANVAPAVSREVEDDERRGGAKVPGRPGQWGTAQPLWKVAPSGLAIPLQPSLANLVFADKLAYAYVALGLVAAYYLLTRVVAASKIGYSLVAFRENDDAARALGIRTLPVRIGIFALSAVMTSLCGTLHAQYFLYIDPDSVMSLNLSLTLALMAIVGGLGTAHGPIIGAMLVTAVSFAMQAYLGNQISGLTQIAYSAIVIAVLLSAPAGLGPALGRLVARRPAWQR